MSDGTKRPGTLPPLRPSADGALVSIKINGQDVLAHKGLTILEAAKSAGVKIPHLCILKGLEPFGGCRVCVVEVAGEERPVPSCATYIAEGMDITTESEHLSRLRHTYLELLLSDHNAFCLPPCKYGCPTNVDIPGFIKAIVEGDYDESQRILKANLPFPATVGRVCPHPCEGVCRRCEVEEPISIRLSHRFTGDMAIEHGFAPEQPEPATGKRVAVIGAGPAGLANAYYLALKGHSVTIFESLPQPGGELRYGIPEYRLPKKVLDAELEPLWKMGVELKTNVSLGPDLTIDDLLGEHGFDAVFLGIGALQSREMRVEGEDLEGVIPVIDYLRDVALGNPPEIGDRVAVIGGGFSAMDAARVSKRLGARDVMVLYRRTQKEMPAHEIEVRDAMEEGVEFTFLVAPVKVEGKDGHVSAITCQKMELGEPDASGRRRPQPVAGSDYTIELDTIIPAIGQTPRLTFERDGAEQEMLPESTSIGVTRWKTIDVNPRTYQSGRPQVFSAGDAVTGAATVVEAIGGAKKAAWAMDAFLKGRDMTEYEDSLPALTEPPMIAIPAFREEKVKRLEPDYLPVQERTGNFVEIEQGFTEQAVRSEDLRCLQCICEGVETCKLRRYSIKEGLLQEERNRFAGRQHLYGRDTTHGFIQRDPSRCIDCGRCVRVCKYWTGSGVYEFINRGPDTIVTPAFDRSLNDTDCVSCGRCAIYCPTGALFTKERSVTNWHLDTSRCIFCADCVEVCPVEALAITPAFELASTEHGELHCNLLAKARGDDLQPVGTCQVDHSARPGQDHSAKEYQAAASPDKARTAPLGSEAVPELESDLGFRTEPGPAAMETAPGRGPAPDNGKSSSEKEETEG